MGSLDLPSDFMERGAFSVPHILYAFEARLDKHERLLLTALLALEAQFTTPNARGWFDGWFYATNVLVHSCSGISLRQIPVIRERLCRKGWLAFRRGYTGRATQYRVLLDPFYRVGQPEKPPSH